MHSFRHPIAISSRWSLAWVALVLVAALVFAVPAMHAQSSAGTLDGVVADASGAVVPGATVVLKNQASGDERSVVSNGEGYFTFAAVLPGAYTVTVSRQGFATWQAKDLAMNSGDHRTLSSIRLKIGAKDETVVVEGSETQITPTDSGEKSFTIGQNIMQNVAIIGQNAAEFIKIMPGMAMTAGATNTSSYTASNEGTGSGPIGSFSANGQRTGALDITADGAHIIDPGCNCGQAENTNQEMTSEVTVMTSNFGADSAKGPVVINTVGKSGGQQFHGELYAYSRYYSLNANDWLNNNAGTNPSTGKQVAPRPETKYFYPGGNISGPVILPKTNFNRNRDKLFFFFGTEYYKQNIDNGIYQAAVPTDAMRAGDFTQPGQSDYAYLQSFGGGNYSLQGVPGGTTAGASRGGPNNNAFTCLTSQIINGNPTCQTSMLTAQPDNTGTGPALVNIYPHADVDPAANKGFNYISSGTRFANMIQYRGRIDYSISNSTKLYVQYNHQNDNAENSLDTLWTGNATSWVSPTTPYPTPTIEKSDSEVLTAGLTKVFTPTLTNELVFNYVYLNLPNTLQDPAKAQRGTLGINYQMLFSHPNQQNIIFPQLTGWGDGIANELQAGFELNGTVFAKKTLPSVADNISKVWRTHTAKFGFYWERTWNSQPGNNDVNGQASFANWAGGSSGNAYADMLIGQFAGYGESNFDVTPAFRYLSTEFYGMDSWKVTRKITLDYGLRFSHLGPWVDTTGYGFAAWYPSLYASGQGAPVPGGTGQIFPGIEWHKANSSTSAAGSGSRLLFYNPRFGIAWDIFGTGNTVFRGGFGIYHFHDEQNVQNPAYGIVRGAFGSPGVSNSNFSLLTPNSALSIPSSVSALDPRDDQEPRTQDWSVTVAQRMPWHSLMEVSYVGSKSDYLSNYNNNFDQINDVGIGTLFNSPLNPPGYVTPTGWLADCDVTATTGVRNCESPGSDPSGTPNGHTYTNGYDSNQQQHVRPLQAYGSLKIIDHKMYSNYNALQVTWNKQQGSLFWLANYTFSKALGIRGESGSATGNPLSLRDNYGTLPNNRPSIFNLALVYQVPGLRQGSNALARGAINGWELSGITQYQSGADLQAAVTTNFGYTAYIPQGTTFMGKTTVLPIQGGNQNVLGTPDITLMPALICDPRKGLHSGQYINGACFANTVTPGVQGQYIFPSLIGPGFFDSDLSVYKNFVFGNSESKKLQFRFSGYNFLNHPIRSFNGSGDNALKLNFNASGALEQPAPGVEFGYTDFKTGHRIVQGEAKFVF